MKRPKGDVIFKLRMECVFKKAGDYPWYFILLRAIIKFKSYEKNATNRCLSSYSKLHDGSGL